MSATRRQDRRVFDVVSMWIEPDSRLYCTIYTAAYAHDFFVIHIHDVCMPYAYNELVCIRSHVVYGCIIIFWIPIMDPTATVDYELVLSILYTVCILDNSSSSSTILASSTMHSMNTIILCIQLFELVRKSSRTMRNKIQHDVSISTMHTAVCVVRNLIVINIPAARRARM